MHQSLIKTLRTRQALLSAGWHPTLIQPSTRFIRFSHPEKTHQTAGGDLRPSPLYLFLGRAAALRAGPTLSRSRSITDTPYHRNLLRKETGKTEETGEDDNSTA